ncbi:MAG: hypothetical protein IKO67_02475 [Bacteroidaceae bacterium]|nr:hypothetical protein [Bacteroidaceae bacterium]
MNTISMNNLWSYLEGLSLTSANQRWLGKKLIKASAAKTSKTEEEKKLKKLDSLFGVWANTPDGEQIEKVILDARTADYEREVALMDD